MVSIVRLSAALRYAWCELLCPRLSTGRFRETKRFPEWCGLLNESLSKLLYICGLERMDWPSGSPTPVPYTERWEEGSLVLQSTLPFPRCVCLPYTSPPLYSGHNLQHHPSNIQVHSLQINDCILTWKRYWEEGEKGILGWTERYMYILLPEPDLARKELVYIYMAL